MTLNSQTKGVWREEGVKKDKEKWDTGEGQKGATVNTNLSFHNALLLPTPLKIYSESLLPDRRWFKDLNICWKVSSQMLEEDRKKRLASRDKNGMQCCQDI